MQVVTRYTAGVLVALLFWMSVCSGAGAQDRAPVDPARPASLQLGQQPAAPPPANPPADKKPAEASTGDDTEIRIEPFIWLPSMDMRTTIGDARIPRTLEIDQVVHPSDLKGKLHFAFTGRVEGRDGRFGGFGEVFYTNASSGGSWRSFGGTLNSKVTVAELAAFYRVSPGEIPVDVIAGARMFSYTNTLDFNNAKIPQLAGQGISVSRGNTDINPIIGLRVAFPLSKEFFMQVHGDYGGFGIGNNQQTWRAEGGFGWNMSEKVRLLLGYTAIGFSSSGGSGTTTFKNNTTLFGPSFGASFKL